VIALVCIKAVYMRIIYGSGPYSIWGFSRALSSLVFASRQQVCF